MWSFSFGLIFSFKCHTISCFATIRGELKIANSSICVFGQDAYKLETVEPVLSDVQFDNAVRPIIQEYLEHGDTAEVEVTQQSVMMYCFVMSSQMTVYSHEAFVIISSFLHTKCFFLVSCWLYLVLLVLFKKSKE